MAGEVLRHGDMVIFGPGVLKDGRLWLHPFPSPAESDFVQDMEDAYEHERNKLPTKAGHGVVHGVEWAPHGNGTGWHIRRQVPGDAHYYTGVLPRDARTADRAESKKSCRTFKPFTSLLASECIAKFSPENGGISPASLRERVFPYNSPCLYLHMDPEGGRCYSALHFESGWLMSNNTKGVRGWDLWMHVVVDSPAEAAKLDELLNEALGDSFDENRQRLLAPVSFFVEKKFQVQFVYRPEGEASTLLTPYGSLHAVSTGGLASKISSNILPDQTDGWAWARAKTRLPGYPRQEDRKLAANPLYSRACQPPALVEDDDGGARQAGRKRKMLG